MSRISVRHNAKDVYMVNATLLKAGPKINRVMFEGHNNYWPTMYAEQVSPGRWAVDVEFFDQMYEQQNYKKIIMVKATFARNKQKVPSPRIKMPRLGKN